ncbi:MAG: tetratricopeptide repeat protein [Fimbriimonadaceae bacterium]|nr:tetratricopeptide repeat protein [Fimbriimonadaceae bacterium]
MKSGLLLRGRTSLILLVAIVGAAQAEPITDQNIHDFMSQRGTFQDEKSSITAAKTFLRREHPDHPLRAAVSFRLGSLLLNGGKPREAERVYLNALHSKRVTPQQRFALWLNAAQVAEGRGDANAALKYFRKSQAHFAGASAPEKTLVTSWIQYLEVRSDDRSVADHAVRRVIQQVESGDRRPELVANVQAAFQRGPIELQHVLFQKIVRRFVEKSDPSDATLLLTAFSHYRGFEDGYPSVTPFGRDASRVERRLRDEPQSEHSLMLQVNWSQALHDHDRKACLQFTAAAVRRLRTVAISEPEREAAIVLVKELRSVASERDRKAQALIQQKSKELGASSVAKRANPTEPVPTPSPLALLPFVGAGFGLAFLPLVGRAWRRRHAQ